MFFSIKSTFIKIWKAVSSDSPRIIQSYDAMLFSQKFIDVAGQPMLSTFRET